MVLASKSVNFEKMEFSELSPKIHIIGPFAVKITYDSKHAVWVEQISFIAT
jgi:hypothetical protein